MDELKNLKKITDEELKDISVTPDLMEKTLRRCKPKKSFPTASLSLTAAACFILVIGYMNFSGLFQKEIENSKIGTTPNVFTTNAEDTSVHRILKNFDEAKEYFGDALLSPSYVAEGFHLDTINATGESEKAASQIVLTYLSDGGKSYLIIEQKTTLTSENRTSKTINIDGSLWYSISSGNADLTTELTRYSSGVQYSISGEITETEAIEIATSMN